MTDPKPPLTKSELAFQNKITLQLGLRGELTEEWVLPVRDGVKFCEAQTKVLASMVASGECGPGPGSLVQSAALQLVMSRWLVAKGMKTDDPALLKLGSEMANHSRQNLLAAVALCQSESVGRRADKRRKKVSLAELLGTEGKEDDG